MSKNYYLVKNPKNFIDFLKAKKEEKEKKEENFCSKCGTEMILSRTGQGWGHESVYKCPNCPPDNHKNSKGFGG